MTPSRKISASRAIWLVAGLYWRRQLNVWRTARLGRKLKDNPDLKLSRNAPREGTSTKSRRGSIFSTFILLTMALNAFFIGTAGLTRLSTISRDASFSAADGIAVSPATMLAITQTETALRRAKEISELGRRYDYLAAWHRFLDDNLVAEVRREGLSEDDEDRHLQEMRAAFRDKGSSGFSARRRQSLLLPSGTWPGDPQSNSIFFRLLGLIVLLWMSLMVFGSLGLQNVNLGEVEWSFEWFYTFPAPSRALFASKMFVYGFLNPLIWVFFFPFLILVYVAAGYGWYSVLIALGALVYLASLAGALCSLAEVAFRKYVTLAHLKNIQALCTILGTGSFLLVYAVCLSRSLQDFLIARARTLPPVLSWNPLTLPLALGLRPAVLSGASIAALMVVIGATLCAASLLGCEWLTRDGLMKAGGPYQGTRASASTPAPSRPRRSWLSGIPGRELLLLTRDRNLFVQVIVVPLLMPGFYLLIYSGMMTAATRNFRHAAVIAFGIGAYSLMSSAMPVLMREKKTLWQSLTYPHSLAAILRQKVVVWAVLAVLYGGAALLLITRFGGGLHRIAWSEGFLALYGIALYAFIAAGIGILATNVLDTDARARPRAELVYLYMILAAMYANTIYSTSAWAKLAQLVLSTLLAFALWQKVDDRAPYLLDPVAQPPRTIGLADGLIAALAFFVAQALVFIVLQTVNDASAAAQTALAYIFAGLIISPLALYILWRQDIPDLWRRIGFTRDKDETRPHSLVKGIALGAVLGGVAGIAGIVYVRGLNFFPQGRIWKQDAQINTFLSPAGQPFWLCLLAIVAAPLFEEFLFRGLIFRGLRRTTGPALAVMGSAALFALVHPPISVIPVFGLGVAAAITFQESGFLFAPMITHAVYNTLVIFFNKP